MKTTTAIALKSFRIILKTRNGVHASDLRFKHDNHDVSIESVCGSFQMQATTQESVPIQDFSAALHNKSSIIFITGDASSLPQSPDSPLQQVCNGATSIIDIDLFSLQLTIHSSLTGLPPVFIRQNDKELAIGSDLHLFRDCTTDSLVFDPESIKELSIIGYPIAGKTLFKDIRMLPAGHSLNAGTDQETTITRYWSYSTATERTIAWHEFTELQSKAFEESMANIDFSGSFLSLTAGMDTRAILAALATSRVKIHAYTMSGKTLTLDARTAKKLCDAYGMSHSTVHLDDHFLRKLPSYCEEACKLTGGLSSLSQAHEIYFYSQIQEGSRARLSGNLGNQVGRGGAENISLRNAGFSAIHPDLSSAIHETELHHWYAPFLESGGNLSYTFLLEQEIPYSSVGNYCLGNSYAIQQTPYAGRELIDISANRPKISGKKQESSLMAMRFKDLHHRFLGEPEQWSFQRQFIRKSSGPVADIPINWGGKAGGGVSPGGVLMGLRALGDAVLASKKIDSGPLYTAASVCGIAGIHEYRPLNKWLKEHLHDFAQDVFHDTITRECGLFHMDSLVNEAKEYFAGNTAKFNTMLYSLDLALAAQIYKAKLA